MLVVLAIAAIAILACVVLVSLGRGGELTEFPPDVPPLDLPEPGQLTAVDFMALQLPVNLVGYHTQSVDETLRRAAGAISARDTRIAVLEQRVSELLSSRLYARQEIHAAPGAGPRTDHAPQAPAAYRELPESGDPVPGGGAWDDDADGQYTQWRVPPRDAAVEQASNGASPAAHEPWEGPGTGDGPSPGDGDREGDGDWAADGRRAADGGERAEPEGVTQDGEGPHGMTRDGEREEPPAEPIEAETAGTTPKNGTETSGTGTGTTPTGGTMTGGTETVTAPKGGLETGGLGTGGAPEPGTETGGTETGGAQESRTETRGEPETGSETGGEPAAGEALGEAAAGEARGGAETPASSTPGDDRP
ncbi:hypothetical protein E1292_25020 [Nonomuraea deserti]|uniref:DivIVA domain-containing protein n=1 Tax=Nonomuraea deserti TaxID=1848322 RepID=A0A4R4VHW9_9ACTN|nr:hypothetical protein [Nonomuraea deserti]TDD01804.1 hypothetical protein E1292_25020 [Nonomuraea deserti]